MKTATPVMPAATQTRAVTPWLGTLLEEFVLGGRASRFWRGAWLVVVILATASAVLVAKVHADVLPAVGIPLAGLATAPLLLVRRFPVTGLALVAAANAVFVIDSRLPWPPTAVMAWLVALAVCPLVVARPVGLLIVGVSEVAALTGACVPATINMRPWDAPITEALAVLLAWGVGESLRARRESELKRAITIASLRRLQERNVLAQGRAGIARELHDVVAHQVSLIAVRAATAPYQLDDLSPATRMAFAEIADQARTALEELRTVLGVLRTPDGTPPQAPQPGLADVGELIERMETSGMRIAFRTHGSPTRVSEGVELCCYRLVQEALTNAARHAPGAPVAIDIDHGATITILVSNPVDSAAGQRKEASSGFGLIGMRERVTALGGQFEAGLAQSEFQVKALVPAVAPTEQAGPE